MTVKKRILIFGLGRMGLTHLSLLSAYIEEQAEFFVYEPNFVNRALFRPLKTHIKLTWVISESELACLGKFDLCMICSPPAHHHNNVVMVRNRASTLFVEKPLLTPRAAIIGGFEKVEIGYVLRHNPLVRYLSEQIEIRGLRKLEMCLRANTILSANAGWRGDERKGGGVVNEFGCHLINLAVKLAGTDITLAGVSKASIYSESAPDTAELTLQRKDTKISIDLNWSDPTVRKPKYQIDGEYADGEKFSTDLFEFIDVSEAGNSRRINNASIGSSSRFYLRGFEFSEQIANLLQGKNVTEAALEDALRTDELIAEVSAWT